MMEGQDRAVLPLAQFSDEDLMIFSAIFSRHVYSNNEVRAMYYLYYIEMYVHQIITALFMIISYIYTIMYMNNIIIRNTITIPQNIIAFVYISVYIYYVRNIKYIIRRCNNTVNRSRICINYCIRQFIRVIIASLPLIHTILLYTYLFNSLSSNIDTSTKNILYIFSICNTILTIIIISIIIYFNYLAKNASIEDINNIVTRQMPSIIMRDMPEPQNNRILNNEGLLSEHIMLFKKYSVDTTISVPDEYEHEYKIVENKIGFKKHIIDTITQNEFINGDNVVQLRCNHIFEETSVLQWFSGHRTCPICRHD